MTPDICLELLTKQLLTAVHHDDGGTNNPTKQDGTLSVSDLKGLIMDVHRLFTIFHTIIDDQDDEEDENETEKGGSSLPSSSLHNKAGHNEQQHQQQQGVGVHVRLECLDTNGCQFWHQDTVPLRFHRLTGKKTLHD